MYYWGENLEKAIDSFPANFDTQVLGGWSIFLEARIFQRCDPHLESLLCGPWKKKLGLLDCFMDPFFHSTTDKLKGSVIFEHPLGLVILGWNLVVQESTAHCFNTHKGI